MFKSYIFMIIVFTGFQSLAEGTAIAKINSSCISGLNRYFAPYVNLPERQGTFEHFQIRSERVGLADVTYWDDTRMLGSSELKSRHIFTTKGTYQCYYPSGLSPEDLVFDAETLAAGGVDILKRNRTFLAGASISCRKTDLFPSELLNTYISSLPQLYGELLTDKSSAEGWSRVAGNYTPQNILFNALKSCKSIPGSYGKEIDRKMPRLQANWNAVQGGLSSGATEASYIVE